MSRDLALAKRWLYTEGKSPLLDSLPVFGASMTGSPLNASQVILDRLRIGLKNGEVKFSLVIIDRCGVAQIPNHAVRRSFAVSRHKKSPLAKHPNLCAKVQLDNVGVQSHCLSSCDPDSIGGNLCSIFETSDDAAVWWLNRSSWVSLKKYRGIILRVEYGDECSQDFWNRT